ncbi:hypothetical protein, partial [Turicimonas muris]|uniref:hypothetical protein n=1 Tax=Turicimonas muris TaxID=1796652 RepID=UPI002633CADC
DHSWGLGFRDPSSLNCLIQRYIEELEIDGNDETSSGRDRPFSYASITGVRSMFLFLTWTILTP